VAVIDQVYRQRGMTRQLMVQRLLWIDGSAALAAGTFVLLARRVLATFYAMPLEVITGIGLVNVGYAAFSLTLASRSRRPLVLVVTLAAANATWAGVCVWIAQRFWSAATAPGLTHVLFEAAFVATLAVLEWRYRTALANPSPQRGVDENDASLPR
jgi:hypothetical protein